MRPLRFLLVGIFALLPVLTSFSAPTPAYAEAYNSNYSNHLGEELMRLTNLDRVSLGKAALVPDKFLIELASNKATTCPSNSALTVRGRSRDMIDRNYFSHSIMSCRNSDGTDFKFWHMATRLGYTGWASMGENIGSSNWGIDAVSYTYGCDVYGNNCKGTTPAVVPQVISRGELMFMKSSAHRAALLGDWTRFGCAVWTKPYVTGSLSSKILTCLFSSSGPSTSYLDKAGPAFSSVTGNGDFYAPGSTVTFSATATDALSNLSDGNVTLDGTSNLTTGAITGKQLKRWAYDHTGHSAALSIAVDTGSLSPGSHTLRWLMRDAATNQSAVSITFTVGLAPTPAPTATPAATPAPTATLAPTPTPLPGPAGLVSKVTVCGTASLRTGPGANYLVWRTISVGTVIATDGNTAGGAYSYACPLSGSSSYWARVYYAGSTYYATPLYIQKNYLP